MLSRMINVAPDLGGRKSDDMSDSHSTAPDRILVQAPMITQDTIDDTIVLYSGDRGGMVHLNASAALVWSLCDGVRQVSDIVALLNDAFAEDNAGLTGDVHDAIRMLEENGFLIVPGTEAVSAPPEEPSPPASPPMTMTRYPRRITIGMATYDDYDGVYFSIQSLRFNNPWLDQAAEFIVVDNNPTGKHAKVVAMMEGAVPAFRYIPAGDWEGTGIREIIFREAASPIVLCMDCHVLVVPGALEKLLDLLENDPASARDLIQGPMLADRLTWGMTHFAPEWIGGGFWGTYRTDPRGNDPDAPGFEIWAMGLALFACRKEAWPGFNPNFRGYGGEEGYIHEKFRQRGGRAMCWPFLRWIHRAHRPNGVPYPPGRFDMFRNYYLGHRELGLDTKEMLEFYANVHGADYVREGLARIEQEGLG